MKFENPLELLNCSKFIVRMFSSSTSLKFSKLPHKSRSTAHESAPASDRWSEQTRTTSLPSTPHECDRSRTSRSQFSARRSSDLSQTRCSLSSSHNSLLLHQLLVVLLHDFHHLKFHLEWVVLIAQLLYENLQLKFFWASLGWRWKWCRLNLDRFKSVWNYSIANSRVEDVKKLFQCCGVDNCALRRAWKKIKIQESFESFIESSPS